MADLNGDTLIYESLQQLFPTKKLKWTEWAKILTEQDIDCVEDLRSLDDEFWIALKSKLTPLLANGLNQIRASGLAEMRPLKKSKVAEELDVAQPALSDMQSFQISSTRAGISELARETEAKRRVTTTIKQEPITCASRDETPEPVVQTEVKVHYDSSQKEPIMLLGLEKLWVDKKTGILITNPIYCLSDGQCYDQSSLPIGSGPVMQDVKLAIEAFREKYQDYDWTRKINVHVKPLDAPAGECPQPTENNFEFRDSIICYLDRLSLHLRLTKATATSSVKIEDFNGPMEFRCPITQEIMKDPVLVADGFMYEKVAILEWFKRSNKSPLTNMILEHTRITPNVVFRNAIETWAQESELANRNIVTLAQLQIALESALVKLQAFEPKANRNTQSLSDVWLSELDDLKILAATSSQWRIGVVGTSGRGKSTLLNALVLGGHSNVDESIGNILAANSMGFAVTNTVWEIGYECSLNPARKLRARLHFLTMKEWEESLDDLITLVTTRDRSDGFTRIDLSLDSTLENLFGALTVADPTDIAGFKTQLLNFGDKGLAGSEAREIFASNSSDLKAEIAHLLQGNAWYSIKKIEVFGPFDICKDGIVLVDMPGLSDTNKAREAVARKALRSCNLILVVAEIKRYAHLEEVKEYYRLVKNKMNQLETSVVFVGSATDSILVSENTAPLTGLGKTATEFAELSTEQQEIQLIAGQFTETEELLDLFASLREPLTTLKLRDAEIEECRVEIAKHASVVTSLQPRKAQGIIYKDGNIYWSKRRLQYASKPVIDVWWPARYRQHGSRMVYLEAIEGTLADAATYDSRFIRVFSFESPEVTPWELMFDEDSEALERAMAIALETQPPEHVGMTVSEAAILGLETTAVQTARTKKLAKEKQRRELLVTTRPIFSKVRTILVRKFFFDSFAKYSEEQLLSSRRESGETEEIKTPLSAPMPPLFGVSASDYLSIALHQEKPGTFNRVEDTGVPQLCKYLRESPKRIQNKRNQLLISCLNFFDRMVKQLHFESKISSKARDELKSLVERHIKVLISYLEDQVGKMTNEVEALFSKIPALTTKAEASASRHPQKTCLGSLRNFCPPEGIAAPIELKWNQYEAVLCRFGTFTPCGVDVNAALLDSYAHSLMSTELLITGTPLVKLIRSFALRLKAAVSAFDSKMRQLVNESNKDFDQRVGRWEERVPSNTLNDVDDAIRERMSEFRHELVETIEAEFQQEYRTGLAAKRGPGYFVRMKALFPPGDTVLKRVFPKISTQYRCVYGIGKQRCACQTKHKPSIPDMFASHMGTLIKGLIHALEVFYSPIHVANFSSGSKESLQDCVHSVKQAIQQLLPEDLQVVIHAEQKSEEKGDDFEIPESDFKDTEIQFEKVLQQEIEKEQKKTKEDMIKSQEDPTNDDTEDTEEAEESEAASDGEEGEEG